MAPVGSKQYRSDIPAGASGGVSSVACHMITAARGSRPHGQLVRVLLVRGLKQSNVPCMLSVSAAGDIHGQRQCVGQIYHWSYAAAMHHIVCKHEKLCFPSHSEINMLEACPHVVAAGNGSGAEGTKGTGQLRERALAVGSKWAMGNGNKRAAGKWETMMHVQGQFTCQLSVTRQA